ncbi:MICROTUBULE-BINDING PROTEIN TANGLED-RELATED [Salix koriyanagi]|uniref:MICROTUBULE-BINDING PROTEIN TANGLED-RELATED n=1 Tax=Salix koriyanagi TaxID=2511006 RepID=A0A9Q0VYJ1_9ROSI|nr:MICROTUBULE-BINDING PROTEIN TANGLED-RELATED [Salix koriyanagi]
MVARTPPKQRKMVAPLNPVLLRETVKKVERCMARLQELQYTVAGGEKVIDGVSLSPRSTRGYLRTSLRCKQESLRRIKSSVPKKSPVGKLPAPSLGEWRQMSLPAMLVEGRRKKQTKLQSTRSESGSPCLLRARSRINFKVSPPKKSEVDKENARYLANRVSPRNRPWAKKTVLFPNPLFLSTDSTQLQKFCKTRSPVIGRSKKQTTPHKFLIKSPPSGSKFQVKIKNPPVVSLSPTRPANLSKKSPKLSTASKLRRSFSPSRLANKLVSPLKGRKIVQKSDGLMSGLKQRPIATPRRFSLGRI